MGKDTCAPPTPSLPSLLQVFLPPFSPSLLLLHKRMCSIVSVCQKQANIHRIQLVKR